MAKKQDINLERLTATAEDDDLFIVNESNNDDKVALKAIDELLNLDKLKTISRIKAVQVGNIAKLYLFASTFNVDFTSDLADNILQLQISLSGLGRQELVQLVQQRTNIIDLNGKKHKDVFR